MKRIIAYRITRILFLISCMLLIFSIAPAQEPAAIASSMSNVRQARSIEGKWVRKKGDLPNLYTDEIHIIESNGKAWAYATFEFLDECGRHRVRNVPILNLEGATSGEFTGSKSFPKTLKDAREHGNLKWNPVQGRLDESGKWLIVEGLYFYKVR